MNEIDYKKYIGVILAAVVGGSGASIGTSYVTEVDNVKSETSLRAEMAQMISAHRSDFNHRFERLENKMDGVSMNVGEINGKLSVLIRGMYESSDE
jgi:hypothetical protein